MTIETILAEEIQRLGPVPPSRPDLTPSQATWGQAAARRIAAAFAVSEVRGEWEMEQIKQEAEAFPSEAMVYQFAVVTAWLSAPHGHVAH